MVRADTVSPHAQLLYLNCRWCCAEPAPGFASHIHVQVVIIQRIINQVAKTSDTP
jgi:hypothetical protein